MSDSKKHQGFAKEPMEQKVVKELPGIGTVRGTNLNSAGYEKAYQIFGKYLALKKDDEKFKRWLHYMCSANAKEQEDCLKGLKEWAGQFFK